MIALLLATAVNTHATVTLRAPENFERGVANEITLEFQIKPDWHIYWENPGDSGEEPRATWAASSAVSVGRLEYPIPQRLPAGPFTNFGFSSSATPTVFRVPVTISGSDDRIDLSLALTYLVCKEECVPEKANLKLKVPVVAEDLEERRRRVDLGSVDPGRVDERKYPKRFGAGSRAEPRRARYQVLNLNASDAASLYFELPLAWARTSAFQFFPLTSPALVAGDAGELVTHASSSGLPLFRVGVDKSLSIKDVPPRITGLLVSGDGARAEWVEYEIEHEFDFGGLLSTLGFAFLGGLILNLMPCVFPVVSLKVLSFVREGAGEKSEIRRHAYAYTVGILVSLWALVGALLFVRAAGASVGWGFQLQNPIFLFVLLGIFFLLGLNLLGIFEINYAGPARLQNLMMKRGLAGSFFTGLLTTVVATPCSAPFMGVAIGAALAGGAAQAVAVFTMLALGLAAPYLILAFFPAWISLLPRPGVWMERLKEFLAFPLLLTAVWIFWVLTQTVDIGALIPVLAWCVFAGFFAWTLSLEGASRGVRAFRFSAAVLLALMTMVSITALSGASNDVTNAAANDPKAWPSYSDQRLRDELAAGKSVFVDFTASWCVTCQVNKRLVLSTEAATDLFKNQNVVKLRADWTKRDSEITNALTKLGRNSVPVYAFYRNGSANPKLLPEILTFDILKTTLEEK